jgi:tetratricopeptide (TPR) repeat protein
MVVHFHAALLDRRGEFDTAIAVLSRLADTDEGRKAAYFKDLSELQQRAGKTVEALATVERWKQSAPGDKTAWITGSRLLRDNGKPEEAVKMTRQAVSRFEGDADLAASLASLHDEAGQWADAEAIYWRLYDEAQSPGDQARWAAQLAQLSQRTAKTAELEEKLRERARGNRRSIGPVLAQAELARVTNNEDKRRDLLLEAVRLQPKDVDLRIQIANLEEQAGNPDRVLAVLEEALPYDVNGRVRSSLAQAYLRQGQAVKGMRELRLLAGKAGFDPRSAESAASSLAGTKLFDEAISLLRSELPDGGDWRTRYLLAMLLEEDGREAEALPIFLSLLQAQGEIPTLLPPVASGPNELDEYTREVRSLYELMGSSEAAYAHRNNNQGYGRGRSSGFGLTQTGPFSLPDKVEEVRKLSLIHLCNLSKKKTGEVDESIRAQIKATGIDNVAFVSDLIAATQEEERGGLMKLLETYPDQPGLYEWLMSYGGMYNGYSGMDHKITRRVLEHPEKLTPMARFIAWASLTTTAGADDQDPFSNASPSPNKMLKPEDPVWTSMLEAAKAGIEEKNGQSRQMISWRLMNQLQAEPKEGGFPEIHRAAAKKLLLDAQAKYEKEHPEDAHNGYALTVLEVAGTPEAWLEELNATIREMRKKPAISQGGGNTRLGQILRYASMSGMSSMRMSGYNPWSSYGDLFTLPTLATLPVRSIPEEVLSVFNANPDNGRASKPLIKIEDLLKTPEKIESTYLRAWLAAKAGNKEAVAKALAATPVNQEICDFELLRAVMLIEEKKLPEAFAALQKARAAAGSDREISGSINVSLIAVAGAMTPEQRTAIAADLQATFLQSRQMFGQQGAPVLAAQARKLGLEDLAKRIDPVSPAGQKGAGPATGPAAIAAVVSGSSSSSGIPDKISKFVSEKKYEAAAREVLQNIRTVGAQNSPYYFSNELPELLSLLGKDGQAELLKQVDPGDSKSLVKRLDYVAVVQAMGRPELSLPVLEALVKERPDDASISARLVFVLPDDQMDRRVKLMANACKLDAFVNQAHQMAEQLDSENDARKAMSFFEAVTRWLEAADDKAMAGANLSWVSYHAKEFFDGDYAENLPSLLSTTEEPKEDKAAYEKFRALGNRLARAMLRHSACAEEGFRLLSATKTLKIEPAEMDELARKALLSTADPNQEKNPNRYLRPDFFMLILPGGGGSSGENYSEYSSANWLIKRFKEVKAPAEILTPGFVTSLKALNPEAGSLMETFSRELKNEDLAVLWKSEVMKSDSTRFSQMLRPVLIKRLATAPGATKFFVDKISQIAPGSAVSRNGGSEDRERLLPMFSAALGSAAAGKPEDLDAVAKSISRAIFGEKLDFTGPKSHQENYMRVNFMEKLSQEFTSDAAQMVRYHGAFMRLGVPVDDDGYSAMQPFRNRSFQKIEDFEAFVESLGWLSEFDRWEPFACMLYRTSNGADGSVQITIQPTLLSEQVLQYMNVNFDRNDAVKKLKERKKGRFGALMTAAALSSGKQRSELAGLAFTEVSASLSKLSPERIESLSLVLPWLPDDVRAKLPEVFRRKVQAADAKKRQEATAAADQFLASLKSPQSRYAMNNLATVVMALIPYDLDKAVEVFVTADQDFTDSLGRGVQFSSNTTNDYQISERDESFGRIFQSYSGDKGPFANDPKLRLKFLSKILASPSGKRLIYMDSNYSDRSVFATTARILLNNENGNRNGNEHLMRMLEVYKALDAESKPMGLACLMLAEVSYVSTTRDQAMTKKIEAAVGGDPLAGRLAAYRTNLMYGATLKTPEEKAEACKLLAGILEDQSIPDVVRVMIAAQAFQATPRGLVMDETTLSALVKLYQEFCAGERSAVTPVSGSLFASLTRFPLRTETAAPMYAALANAFWENTAAAKSAGHPAIPASLAQSVYIVTLMGKDSSSAAKVFPRIRSGLSGKLVPLLSLLQLGQADLAKQLAPLPAEPFVVEAHEFRYTKELEDSIAVLRKAGVDPLTMLKLEIEMLGFQVGKDALAPAESLDARVARLNDAFLATPPTGAVFPLSMQILLNRSVGNAKLRPVAVKWLKDNPINGFLIPDDRSSSSDVKERVRKAAVGMHGSFALRALGEGDPSLLESIAKACEQPAGRNNYEMLETLTGLMQAMSRSIWRDVCIDNTAGYKAGMPVWNGLVLQYANQIAKYDPSEVTGVLQASQFLACLTNEQAAFDQMFQKLPESAKQYAKSMNRDGGFLTFIESLNRRSALENLTAAQGKKVFLEKVLQQPSFAASLKKNVGWVNRLTQNLGCKDAIDAISVNPPATLIPEALPALYEYGGRLVYTNEPEKGMALTRKGLDACPADKEWNASRGVLKWQLADQLLAAKKPDESKAIFTTIKPEEVADWLKVRYNNTAKALGIVTPKPQQAPKPPAPVPPKP